MFGGLEYNTWSIWPPGHNVIMVIRDQNRNSGRTRSRSFIDMKKPNEIWRAEGLRCLSQTLLQDEDCRGASRRPRRPKLVGRVPSRQSYNLLPHKRHLSLSVSLSVCVSLPVSLSGFGKIQANNTCPDDVMGIPCLPWRHVRFLTFLCPPWINTHPVPTRRHSQQPKCRPLPLGYELKKDNWQVAKRFANISLFILVKAPV